MPVVGDKSVEFYKDAVSFVDKRISQFESRIFLTRILNKHTVFVASNSGVHQVLQSKFSVVRYAIKVDINTRLESTVLGKITLLHKEVTFFFFFPGLLCNRQ